MKRTFQVSEREDKVHVQEEEKTNMKKNVSRASECCQNDPIGTSMPPRAMNRKLLVLRTKRHSGQNSNGKWPTCGGADMRELERCQRDKTLITFFDS